MIVTQNVRRKILAKEQDTNEKMLNITNNKKNRKPFTPKKSRKIKVFDTKC